MNLIRESPCPEVASHQHRNRLTPLQVQTLPEWCALINEEDISIYRKALLDDLRRRFQLESVHILSETPPPNLVPENVDAAEFQQRKICRCLCECRDANNFFQALRAIIDQASTLACRTMIGHCRVRRTWVGDSTRLKICTQTWQKWITAVRYASRILQPLEVTLFGQHTHDNLLSNSITHIFNDAFRGAALTGLQQTLLSAVKEDVLSFIVNRRRRTIASGRVSQTSAHSSQDTPSLYDLSSDDTARLSRQIYWARRRSASGLKKLMAQYSGHSMEDTTEPGHGTTIVDAAMIAEKFNEAQAQDVRTFIEMCIEVTDKTRPASESLYKLVIQDAFIENARAAAKSFFTDFLSQRNMTDHSSSNAGAVYDVPQFGQRFHEWIVMESEVCEDMLPADLHESYLAAVGQGLSDVLGMWMSISVPIESWKFPDVEIPVRQVPLLLECILMERCELLGLLYDKLRAANLADQLKPYWEQATKQGLQAIMSQLPKYGCSVLDTMTHFSYRLHTVAVRMSMTQYTEEELKQGHAIINTSLLRGPAALASFTYPDLADACRPLFEGVKEGFSLFLQDSVPTEDSDVPSSSLIRQVSGSEVHSTSSQASNKPDPPQKAEEAVSLCWIRRVDELLRERAPLMHLFVIFRHLKNKEQLSRLYEQRFSFRLVTALKVSYHDEKVVLSGLFENAGVGSISNMDKMLKDVQSGEATFHEWIKIRAKTGTPEISRSHQDTSGKRRSTESEHSVGRAGGDKRHRAEQRPKRHSRLRRLRSASGATESPPSTSSDDATTGPPKTGNDLTVDEEGFVNLGGCLIRIRLLGLMHWPMKVGEHEQVPIPLAVSSILESFAKWYSENQTARKVRYLNSVSWAELTYRPPSRRRNSRGERTEPAMCTLRVSGAQAVVLLSFTSWNEWIEVSPALWELSVSLFPLVDRNQLSSIKLNEEELLRLAGDGNLLKFEQQLPTLRPGLDSIATEGRQQNMEAAIVKYMKATKEATLLDIHLNLTQSDRFRDPIPLEVLKDKLSRLEERGKGPIFSPYHTCRVCFIQRDNWPV